MGECSAKVLRRALQRCWSERPARLPRSLALSLYWPSPPTLQHSFPLACFDFDPSREVGSRCSTRSSHLHPPRPTSTSIVEQCRNHSNQQQN